MSRKDFELLLSRRDLEPLAGPKDREPLLRREDLRPAVNAKDLKPLLAKKDMKTIPGSGWSTGPEGESFRQWHARLAREWGEETAAEYTGWHRTY